MKAFLPLAVLAVGLTSCRDEDRSIRHYLHEEYRLYSGLAGDDMGVLADGPRHVDREKIAKSAGRYAASAHAAAYAFMCVCALESNDFVCADSNIAAALECDGAQMEFVALRVVVLRCRGQPAIAAEVLGVFDNQSPLSDYMLALRCAAAGRTADNELLGRLYGQERAFVDYLYAVANGVEELVVPAGGPSVTTVTGKQMQ